MNNILSNINSYVINNLPFSSLLKKPNTQHINEAPIDDIIAGEVAPPWLENLSLNQADNLDILKNLSKKDDVDFTSGLSGTEKFTFKGKWGIDGVYFDGIMNTEHNSSLKLTDFPIQDGSTGTDHAVVEPARLSIDIMMTDCISGSAQNSKSLNAVYELSKKIAGNSNFVKINKENEKSGRSAAAYTVLRAMQLSRKPLTVETRLRSYKNMLIEHLSAPDNFATFNCLRCSVIMREIITVGVPSYQIAQRKDLEVPEIQGEQFPSGSVFRNFFDGMNFETIKVK